MSLSLVITQNEKILLRFDHHKDSVIIFVTPICAYNFLLIFPFLKIQKNFIIMTLHQNVYKNSNVKL